MEKSRVRTVGASPPSGIRSAVHQGGLGAGSIERRADGTFNEWTIMNQSPAAGAKIAGLDAAFIGVRVSVNGRGRGGHDALLGCIPCCTA